MAVFELIEGSHYAVRFLARLDIIDDAIEAQPPGVAGQLHIRETYR